MIRRVTKGILMGAWLFPWWLMLLLTAVGAAAQIALMRKGRGWLMTKLACVVMLLSEAAVAAATIALGRDAIGYAFYAAAAINTALLILVGAAVGFAIAGITALWRKKRGGS